MSWREQLQQASFRGVDFKVDTIRDAEGPQIVLHDYPFASLPSFQWMGEKPHEIQIRAYVIGDDYMAQRDALLDALRTKGEADLVHERRGVIRAVCMDIGTIETRDALGVAKFDLKFVRAQAIQFPQSTVSTASELETAAGAVRETDAEAFAEGWSIEGTAQYVQESAADLVTRATDAISRATGPAATIVGAAETFGFTIAGLDNAAARFLGQPSQLWQRFAAAITDGVAGFSNVTDLIRNYSPLLTFGKDDPAPIETTPNRRQQASNQRAISTSVQTLAIAAAADYAASGDYPYYRDAVRLRDELITHIDRLLEQTSGAQWQALRELAAKIRRDVATRSLTLRRLRTVTLTRTLPAVVVSYRLYGTADRAQEIIDLNDLDDPLFVPGGQPLQVAS